MVKVVVAGSPGGGWMGGIIGCGGTEGGGDGDGSLQQIGQELTPIATSL